MKRTLVIAAIAACTSRAPVAKGIELADLDRAADPCTDFYQFATGGFHAAHPIPDGQAHWGRRSAARVLERDQLRDLLAQLARRRDWPAGGSEQLLGDMYASCIAGSGAAMPELTGDVPHAMRRMHALGIAVPFGVIGAMDDREPAQYVAEVIDAPVDHPDRDQLVHALGSAGDADAVIALEARLGSAVADPAPATSKHVDFAQLGELAPHVDWDAYFADAKLPRGTLEVADPAYLQAVDRELAATPAATWTAYLRWQYIHAMSPPANCVDLIESVFDQLLAREYAKAHFPPAARDRMRSLAHALVTELHGVVAAEPWLAAATKATSLAKIDATSFELGYRERATSYAGLKITRDALWANVAAARAFAVDLDRRMIGQPTPRDLWQLAASSPDAYIEPELVQVVLPAGYLQPPVFDAAATDAVVYGAIGVGVAHDLTHAIDESGSKTDVMGRPVDWWTDADRATFSERSKCVAAQFDGYGLDGKRVLSETIGDLAGLHVAFAALAHAPPGPVVDGFTPEQQFFIAWAQFRGEAERPEEQRRMTASDPHPIARLRINGALENTPELARAFGCKAPAKPPCAVW
ncbi:MAG TPA: M13 family metallopeptidase [Kofleriaceae bacterium]|jgi:endothelin-converting enzyme/putative endopeptidase|nr:M13 family metallopeptidase [Kofleriaceae bacterium]